MKTIKFLTTGILFLFLVQFTFAQTTEYSLVKYEVNAKCNACKEKIETELNKTTGVFSSVLDLATKIVTVKYDKNVTSPEKIEAVIINAGYTTKNVTDLQNNQQKHNCNHPCHNKCGK